MIDTFIVAFVVAFVRTALVLGILFLMALSFT